MRHFVLSVPLVGLVLSACGAGTSTGAEQPAAPQGDSRLGPGSKRNVSTGRVEKLNLEFAAVRARDDAAIEGHVMLDDLSQADAICIAEDHDDEHHHWAEHQIFLGMIERAHTSGRRLALGMEMFQRPTQQALNRYLAADQPDEDKFLDETEWDDRWGHDYGVYRPLLDTARTEKLPVLALNAPKKLTRKVARKGLDSLSEEEKAELPKLDLDSAQHRQLFDEATQDHPPTKTKPDDMYAAQVVWDETMADTAATWLAERQPARQLIIVAGANHCRASAIPARITRRTKCKVLTVRPVLENTGTDLGTVTQHYDYAMVLREPPE